MLDSWSEWWDLNPRPDGPKPPALSTVLHPEILQVAGLEPATTNSHFDYFTITTILAYGAGTRCRPPYLSQYQLFSRQCPEPSGLNPHIIESTLFLHRGKPPCCILSPSFVDSWHRREDSNLYLTVLETAVLPVAPHPYVSFAASHGRHVSTYHYFNSKAMVMHEGG